MGTQLNLPTLSAKSIAKDWYLIKKNGNLSSTHWLNSWLGRWEIKNWTLLWCEAHFEVKMCNTHTHSTFGPFYKLRCWTSARHCGAKHALRSKCQNHNMFEPFPGTTATIAITTSTTTIPRLLLHLHLRLHLQPLQLHYNYKYNYSYNYTTIYNYNDNIN